MLRVGFAGWRGMVGSVLLERMRAEGDLDALEVTFLSTSDVGGAAPEGGAEPLLGNAGDAERLKSFDAVVTCQGGPYTAHLYPALRSSGWKGYWIDAASTLRLESESTLVLDPVNGDRIRSQIESGCRTFVGSNCTVGLLLMGIVGLYRAGLVEWVSTMTYQAVSGAGARRLAELAQQMRHMNASLDGIEQLSSVGIERAITQQQRSGSLPVAELRAPLANNVLPWIDSAMENGQTREEWKAGVEAAKILGTDSPARIDGICVRVDALRCHSQALCIKLNREVPVPEIEEIVRGGSPWVRVVENSPEATLRELTPAAVAGTLDIAVGRLRPLAIGPSYLAAFTVGDQLLWGAAEPLRRMLGILREHLD